MVGHRTETEGQVDDMCTWVNYLVSLRLNFSIYQRVHLVTVNMLSVLYPLFSSLRFTAKLRRRYKDVFSLSFPHRCIASPITNIPHQSDTFVTADDPTLKHDDRPKFIVYLIVYLWNGTFFRFGKLLQHVSLIGCYPEYFQFSTNPLSEPCTCQSPLHRWATTDLFYTLQFHLFSGFHMVGST